MMKWNKETLTGYDFSKDVIIDLLHLKGLERDTILTRAYKVRNEVVGNKVFFRGLIEFSNICSKDCLYCGIRKSNKNVIRYDISDEEILDACRFAWENNFGSVVLQSGEVYSDDFIKRVDQLLKKIKQFSNNELGITLSCGEQTKETYRRWFESGAHRYLLRIESSNRELYYKIHPRTKKHSFEKRLESLEFLKEMGYQVGSGVMIGLPFQTFDNLADDLLFLKRIDIDMCGMGPYIEHENTPLFNFRNQIMSKQERFDLTMNMIAVLRLLMPDINIAASTALDAINENGRERALLAGANIIMPNLTPRRYREEYFLYENKPVGTGDLKKDFQNFEMNVISAGCEVGYNLWGDSEHFKKRNK